MITTNTLSLAAPLPGSPQQRSALATFALGVEQDIVSLRRYTRAAGEEFGLDEHGIRSLASAAYEAGRLLFSMAGTANAALWLVDGQALQVTISANSGQLDEARRALYESIEHLRALVHRLSIEETPEGVSVSLSTPVASGVAHAIVHWHDTSGETDTTVAPAVETDVSSAALRSENAALRRALEELRAELQETNSGVVALYTELVEQAEQLRQAEDTVRRRAEDLADANRAKEQFLATLSHELRTPLNAMLGWTRLLRMGSLTPVAHARALETIERNARIQETLIADILDVSRIVTGKLRVHLRPLSLEPIVDAALDSVRPAAEAKGVELACDMRFTGTVLGDSDRLQQVLWNLLANAIKFTPAGGRVTMAVAAVDGKPVLTVADTGEGIPEHLLPYIFDRFTQGDVSATRPQSGLGLGLSIVRHIVELHGGHVEASSDGSQLGSRFTVHLPARPHGHLSGAHEADGASAASPGAATDSPPS